MSLSKPKGVRYSPETLAKIDDLRIWWAGEASVPNIADVIRRAIDRAHASEAPQAERRMKEAGKKIRRNSPQGA